MPIIILTFTYVSYSMPDSCSLTGLLYRHLIIMHCWKNKLHYQRSDTRQLPQLIQHGTSEQRHGCCFISTSQISCLFLFFLTWNHRKKKIGGNSVPTQPRWQNHYLKPLPVPSRELHLQDKKLKDPLALEKIILSEMWLTDIKNRRCTLTQCFLWEDKEETLATFSLTQSNTKWNNESIYCFMEPKEL